MKYLYGWMIIPSLCFVILQQNAFGFDRRDVFEDNQSKYKVLLFLSKGCPCSHSHVKHLNEIAERYKEDVALFGVITDIFDKKSKEQIENYFAKTNFKFSIIKDEEQFLVKNYKALKTPHTVVLSKKADGAYEIVYQGGVTNSKSFTKSNKKFLSENLEALTHGQPLKYAVGKSLGCYIRRL